MSDRPRRAPWAHLFLWLAAVLLVAARPAAAVVRVVAAESSYGGMVKTVGGDHVQVTSLLDSPAVNPHEFQASPRIGRQLAAADLVVINGAGFDAWIEPLLKGTDNGHRRLIRASDAGSALVMADNNPHLFYSPRIMLATAGRVAAALSDIDPAHAGDYRAGLANFRQQLLPVYDQVQRLIAAHPNLTVTATVPVYAYMIRLLGYRDLYHDVQFASMDGAQPSARQVARLMDGLRERRVALLVYNVQVHNRLTKSEVAAARQAGVPVVGVSAIPLHGEDYAQWQIMQLKAIEKALDGAAS